MKHTCRYLIFVIFLLQWFGAKAQNIVYSPSIPVEQHRIMIDHAQGGTVSEMIDDLTYIPLEIKNKKEIISGVFKMALIGNSIGMLSFQNETTLLHIYSTDGKLIKTVDCIKSSGIPKGNNIMGLKIWEDHFILFSLNYKIKIDSKGNSVVLLKDDYVSADSIQIEKSIWKYIEYDSIASSTAALTLNDLPVIEYSEKKNKYFFNKSMYFSPVSVPHGVSYFCPDNHYKIFELDECEVKKVYDFIFPQHNIADTSLVYNSWTDFSRSRSHSMDRISMFDNIIRFNDYLIFMTDFYDFYGFDLKTKDFIGLANIIPDTSNDYMPLVSHYPILTDEKYLYTLINPYMAREAEEECREQGHKMRAEFQDLGNHLNLILVRFKLKP